MLLFVVIHIYARCRVVSYGVVVAVRCLLCVAAGGVVAGCVVGVCCVHTAIW